MNTLLIYLLLIGIGFLLIVNSCIILWAVESLEKKIDQLLEKKDQ